VRGIVSDTMSYTAAFNVVTSSTITPYHRVMAIAPFDRDVLSQRPRRTGCYGDGLLRDGIAN
jgi:hypothetical protein